MKTFKFIDGRENMADINLKHIKSMYIGGEAVKVKGRAVYEIKTTPNAPTRVVNPNGEFWSGQMYVQCYELSKSIVDIPLLLWHGGGLTGTCWEMTPDGREGWLQYFLKKGFSTYISDSVERGRASWSMYPEVYSTEPVFRTYKEAWESFRIGTYSLDQHNKKIPFEGSQFPIDNFDEAMMGAVPRWVSNETVTMEAYNQYIKKVGKCILVAHSNGCHYAFQAMIDNYKSIKALVLIEPSGLPRINQKEMSKLNSIPILVLWGDFLDKYTTWNKNDPNINSYYKQTLHRIKELKNNGCTLIEWIELPEIGIKGNTHMMMSDNNSDEVAEIIEAWLKQVIIGIKIAPSN